jgi:acyl-CoA dehydrogenase
MMDDMLSESIAAMLDDMCTPALVREIESVRDREVGRPLWMQLDESGFLDALVPESAGGAGVPLTDAMGVMLAFGRYAMPLPAAHTMFARRYLTSKGVTVPRGPMTLALADDTTGGIHVPYGLVSDAVLLHAGDTVTLFDMGKVRCIPTGDSRSLSAVVFLDGERGERMPSDAADILTLGAAASAANMAGAMSRIFEITMAHVNDRVQFGRPIGKFQAVQHQLSVMAEDIAATLMAVRMAAAHDGGAQWAMGCAIAKTRASRAAAAVANTAHALTGAMGITAEYDVQLFTRRLHEARLQFGSESYWDEWIGTQVLAHWTSVLQGVIDVSSGERIAA